MAWRSVCKLLQRRSIDLLSQRHGMFVIVISFVILTVTVIQFSETLIEWSEDKYSAVFNSFTDNIVGRSFRGRLCLPIPIDVVYTWVNGSDPRLIAELRSYKQSLEANLDYNLVRTLDKCMFEQCVPELGVVISPAFPAELSMGQVSILYPSLRQVKSILTMDDPITYNNVSVIFLGDEESVKKTLNETVLINGVMASIRRLYYTSDSTLTNSVPSSDAVIVTGFPHQYDGDRLLNELPETYRTVITTVRLHSEQGVAVLIVPDKNVYDQLLKDDNITVNAKTLSLRRANFVWDLNDYAASEDLAASRFEDNEELRYSLRSIERFAPWVRHVYIVTNGQIPSWLNLDNPRVTVITHKDIFLNQSHLPTFSSPAIESHLHRIPGLSDKFVYMNDDVFFGREVWPDDFFTAAGGQKVYLTWPVPNCQEGCPGSWIRDGYCDKACNNSDCEWDGGDCEGDKGAVQPLYQFGGNQGGAAAGYWSAQSSSMYCSTGCANNWIADRYCDQSCNVDQCGFDAADCGTSNFHLLHGVQLDLDIEDYYVEGHKVVFLNYTSLIGDLGGITEGNYAEHAIIRSISIAQKFRVITLVMFGNFSATTLNFTLTGTDSHAERLVFNFTLSVDTVKIAAVKRQNQTTDAAAAKEPDVVVEKEASYVEVMPSFAPPKTRNISPDPKTVSLDDNYDIVNLSLYSLPEKLDLSHKELISQLRSGDLTERGFNRHAAQLWLQYLDWLHVNNRSIERVEYVVAPVAVDDGRKEADSGLHGVVVDRDVLSVKTVTAYNAEGLSRQLRRSGRKRSMPNRDEHYIRNNGSQIEDNKQDLKPNKNAEVDFRDSDPTFRKRKLKSLSEEEQSAGSEPQFSNVGGLLQSSSSVENVGFLPWERLGVFTNLQRRVDSQSRARDIYVGSLPRRRSLLDTFASSLHHVGRTYNRYYGYSARKVPAHMPHMIDRTVMTHMQSLFPVEFDQTSSHRVRSSTDMQFAFSYFYFLLSHPRNVSVSEIFREFDIDGSGVLSDREIRTLAARLYDLPLELESLTSLEQMLMNCSDAEATEAALESDAPKRTVVETTVVTEVYYDQRMPQVTLKLIERCEPLVVMLQKHSKARMQYPFQIVGEDEVTFKMLRNNVTRVIAQLDEVRKHTKKFICLNDNIDYSRDTAKLVKAILHDFYESVLPKPSRFELPKDYRNRFLYVDELRGWWFHRRRIKFVVQVVVIFLVIVAAFTFLYDKISCLRRRIVLR